MERVLAAEQVSIYTDGVYTVSEACRILQPQMTSRKVHYWLDTGLLSEPVAQGRRGSPTLLSFRQLLELRTVQYLRDELVFSLPRVREAFQYILDNLFAESFSDLRFFRGVDNSLVVQVGQSDGVVVPGGQSLLPHILPEMDQHVRGTRESWESRRFEIPDRTFLVSNARVQAGSPTIKGTRIETSYVAAFAEGPSYTQQMVDDLEALLKLDRDSIVEAMEFEGVLLAA